MPDLINPDDIRFHLGVAQMDSTHQEFIELVNKLDNAAKAEFFELFKALAQHTQHHFDAETELMHQSAFPATREHSDEHLRVLGDLSRMTQQVQKGSTFSARAYVREMLPEWFRLHVITMDSALAAHLKSRHTAAAQVDNQMHL